MQFHWLKGTQGHGKQHPPPLTWEQHLPWPFLISAGPPPSPELLEVLPAQDPARLTPFSASGALFSFLFFVLHSPWFRTEVPFKMRSGMARAAALQRRSLERRKKSRRRREVEESPVRTLGTLMTDSCCLP